MSTVKIYFYTKKSNRLWFDNTALHAGKRLTTTLPVQSVSSRVFICADVCIVVFIIISIPPPCAGKKSDEILLSLIICSIKIFYNIFFTLSMFFYYR